MLDFVLVLETENLLDALKEVLLVLMLEQVMEILLAHYLVLVLVVNLEAA